MLVNFGPWRPDTPDIGTGATGATNVVPGVDAYHPQASLVTFSNPIAARCQGAVSYFDSSASVYWFAGDATDLYAIMHATLTWSNMTRIGPVYSTGTTERWSFTQYGDNVYAANYGDAIQIYSLGAITHFANLGGDSPNARYLGVVKNFLVAVNTYDSVDGARPQRVRWSGLDQPLSWTVDATTQADFQDLLGDGGSNQGIVAALTQADAVILQERSVWRMTYQGTPLVFTFDKVEGVRGCLAPGSVISVGGICYYLGEDGFYAFDGAASLPIGQGKVDRTFFADADSSCFYLMSSVADIDKKLIYWSYVSTAAPSGIPDKIFVYSWATGEWSRLEIETEVLWRSLSFGYDLEALDAFGTVDTIDVSFDSRQWSGGIQQLSAFDSSHRSSNFSGHYMAATLISPEITLPAPRRLFVTQTWPIVTTTSNAIRVAVGHRTRSSDTLSYAPSTLMNAIGFCPQRTADHYVRFRMSLSSSLVWDMAVGVDVTLAPLGWR